MTPEFMWAVGLFEGEGYICLQKNNRNPNLVYLYMGMEMVDLDVLIRFKDIVQVGNIRGPYQRPGNRQPTSAWSITGKYAIPLYNKMHPFLSIRRQEKGSRLLGEVSLPVRSRTNA